ncbi:hypothetical protein [Salipaludibacillus sp. CF4.18]|uniref:hypothetical protein n=1 Tax=Salipaludibacillus sp. CF4.18 TaxID=3373081 RepID=UPI003EE69897
MILSAALATENVAVPRSEVDTGNYKSSWAHRVTNQGMGAEVWNSSQYAELLIQFSLIKWRILSF